MAGLTQLILDDIVFRDFEIPEQANFAGKHAHITHKLIGGFRVIDAMGPDDDDIHWSGRFRQPNAMGRALAVDALRQSGIEVGLSFGGVFAMVVVHHFAPDFSRGGNEIPYKITCIVSDSGGGGIGFAASNSLTSIVNSDIAVLTTLAGGPVF